MTKRFGRPAPSFDEKAKSGPIRQINLPREGNSLEGLYALASARSDMRDAPYEVMRKENFNRGLAMWLIFALFVNMLFFQGPNSGTNSWQLLISVIAVVPILTLVRNALLSTEPVIIPSPNETLRDPLKMRVHSLWGVLRL